MSKNSITSIKTPVEIREHLKKNKLEIDPDHVLREIDKEFSNGNNGRKAVDVKSNFFRAMTLVEFENGALMYTIVPEQYRTFAIDFMRQLQEEYNCTLPSEKATTELVTLYFVRILELQRRINNYINDQMSKTDILFFATLSKELDRASRQYLSGLHTLRMLKQPSLNVNIRTNTTIVGQNQLIQDNKNVKPI